MAILSIEPWKKDAKAYFVVFKTHVPLEVENCSRPNEWYVQYNLNHKVGGHSYSFYISASNDTDALIKARVLMAVNNCDGAITRVEVAKDNKLQIVFKGE